MDGIKVTHSNGLQEAGIPGRWPTHRDLQIRSECYFKWTEDMDISFEYMQESYFSVNEFVLTEHYGKILHWLALNI